MLFGIELQKLRTKLLSLCVCVWIDTSELTICKQTLAVKREVARPLGRSCVHADASVGFRLSRQIRDLFENRLFRLENDFGNSSIKQRTAQG